MPNVVETPDQFDAGVYQIETNDPVVGGANGISNKQAIALANRTAFLKKAMDVVIAGEGGAPDNADTSLLYAAIQSAIAAGQSPGLPVGAITICPASVPFTGTLLTSGLELSRATYADLWVYAQASGNIVTDAAWLAGQFGSFSTGDGATTFRIPDLHRGDFVRGLDLTGVNDVGRILGSWQSDMLKSHTHWMRYALVTPGGSSSAAGSIGGAHDESLSTGGVETRPRNIAEMFCIKY